MKTNLVKNVKAGFSLVEMLVVIAVIGIIAAIAVPTIGNITSQANASKAKRNAQSLASVCASAVAAGATHVTPIPLHLRPGVKAAFWPWLEATHPELVATYTELYGPPAAGRKGRATLPEDIVEAMLRTVRDARDAAWAERGNRPPEGSWPDRARPGEHVTGHAGRPSTNPAEPPGAEPPVAGPPAEQLSII